MIYRFYRVFLTQHYLRLYVNGFERQFFCMIYKMVIRLFICLGRWFLHVTVFEIGILGDCLIISLLGGL